MTLSTTARRTAAGLGVVLLALGAGACSSDSGSSASASSSATAASAGVTASDRAGDGATLAPVPTPTVTVTAGSTAAPSAAVAAPSDGASLVPGQAGYTQPESTPVALDKDQTAGDVKVTLGRIISTKGVANGPGEVSGPALVVTVTLENTGSKDVDLAAASVTLSYGKDQTPATTFASMDEAKSVPATVAAGKSVTGSYVFAVPSDEQDDVTVDVVVTTDQPVAVFHGSAS
ncbi:DUF4352 domain-containing protein [Actinomyces haliotis]|uniref:DUF4352 domain-containing protein n=1 Tax=Actinomyces haliotis TaxID=1280843 RepID=UPI00188F08DA|nr:DUF4352 domain-containing protein [Actinomyces haliotis]